jgi:mono/diheme cytochrome c family protein
MRIGEKYDAARVRRPLTALAAVSCALLLAACGSEGVSVSSETNATASRGAEIFATHCAGCHTISAAGTQGSGNRGLRVQGPNFDQRVESYDEALFAIRNGGFSGAIMPQNIVVGEDASLVAEFLAKYSGSDVEESPRPTASPSSETGESDTSPNEVAGTDNQPDESAGGAEGGQAGGSGEGQSGGGTQGKPSDAG